MLHYSLGLDILLYLSVYICTIIVLLIAFVKMLTNKSSIYLSIYLSKTCLQAADGNFFRQFIYNLFIIIIRLKG